MKKSVSMVFVAGVIAGGTLLAASPAKAARDSYGNDCPSDAIVSEAGGTFRCGGYIDDVDSLFEKALRRQRAIERSNPVLIPFGVALATNGGDGDLWWLEDDPYGSYSSVRIAPVRTSLGVDAPGQRANVAGAGGYAHVNASRLIDLRDGDQRLSVGGYFDYRSIDGSFSESTLLFGSTFRRDVHTVGVTAAYGFGSAFVSARFGVRFGDGSILNSDLSRGSFHSLGYEGAVSVGQTLTLADHRTYLTRNSKSAPEVDGGYRLGLTLAGNFNVQQDEAGAFTDTAGFSRGIEHVEAWGGGLSARLFTDIYSGGYVVTPYVAGGFSQLFAWDHHLDIPWQLQTAGHTVYFGAPGRAYANVRSGLNIREPHGIDIGLEGFYGGSSGTNGYGGRAYIRFPLMRWLAIPG